jgi:hypothetical protein
MEENGLPKPDNVIFGEIQVLLASWPPHRYRRVRVAAISAKRADRDLTLLQYRESDAPARASDAPEPGFGRAWHLAGFSFHPPNTPFRTPHPGAERQISFDRAVHRVMEPTPLPLQKTAHPSVVTGFRRAVALSEGGYYP